MVWMEVGEGKREGEAEQAEAVSQIVSCLPLCPGAVPASLRRQEMSRSRRKRRRNLVDRGNRSGHHHNATHSCRGSPNQGPSRPPTHFSLK